MKTTSRPPPTTFEEMKNDVDLGLDIDMEPPHLSLPTQVDPLYVEKPIGAYEPMNQDKRLRQRVAADGNKTIKKKWKSEPTT